MFARTKTYKNQDGSSRQYLEIVENQRVDGKVRQRVVLRLGRLDKIRGDGQLDRLLSSLAKFSTHQVLIESIADCLSSEWARELGPVAVYRRLWENLGLPGFISAISERTGIEHDVEEAIFAMVLNRLMAPESKLGVSRWVKKVYRPEFESLQLQHFYRSLDFLAEHKEELEERLFSRVRDLFTLELDVVFYDTTTSYVHGLHPEELVKFGYSRDNRPDRRQIAIGILMTKDGTPVGHQVFPGNFADVECFLAALADLRCRYRLGRVVMVADRGMVGKTTLAALENEHYQYILGMRMRRVNAARTALAEQGQYQVVSDSLQVREVARRGKRYIVCYNPQEAERDREVREETVVRLRETLKDAGLKGLVGHRGYRRYLRVEGAGGTIDEAKVAAEGAYDGRYILMTNTDLPAAEVALTYKQLWQVERAFRDLKSNLDLRPLYHWTEKRIRGHVMVCFLAFALERMLVRSLKETSPEVNYQQARADLDDLKMVTVQLKGRNYLVRTELQGEAHSLFRAVGARPPQRVTEV